MAKVSVLMSVYGYRNYIKNSIASILNQSFRNLEFIIIDDGCGYDLQSITKNFKDSRIKYIKNERNIGLTRSLIKGIKYCEGKYIARQDAGNISYRDRIEKQYNFLEENPNCFLVGSSIKLVDENGQEICKKIAAANSGIIIRRMPKENMVYHSTIFFRNKGNDFYRPKFKYSQDYDFYLNLLSRGEEICNLGEVLLEERYMGDSITFDKREEQERYANLARDFYLERKNSGKDSYDVFDFQAIEVVEKRDNKNFFDLQKAYYLLFSYKKSKARKIILELIKNKLSFKLLYYFMLSFSPNFLISLIKKVKGINYE